MTDMGDEYLDRNLDELWAEYKIACPSPEVDASFMPRLWRRIDGRRRFSLDVRRMARAFVTAAAAICLAISCILLMPRPSGENYYTATYLDILDRDTDTLTYGEPVGDVR